LNTNVKGGYEKFLQWNTSFNALLDILKDTSKFPNGTQLSMHCLLLWKIWGSSPMEHSFQCITGCDENCLQIQIHC